MRVCVRAVKVNDFDYYDFKCKNLINSAYCLLIIREISIFD